MDSSAKVSVSGCSRCDLIEALEEVNSFQVLAPAELVGDPFAWLPRVVQVEHRCDGIHAETVDVVLLQPEQSAGEQEGSHFVAPVVVDERTPQSWCSPLRGSACFVKGGAGQSAVLRPSARS